MLNYFMTRFTLPPDHSVGPASQMSELVSRCVTDGFFGRTGWIFLRSSDDTIHLGGVLAAPDAFEVALDRYSIKEGWKELCEALSSPLESRVFGIIRSEDSHYCMHTNPVNLRITVDYHFEISPLKCKVCDGVFGRHRIDLGNKTFSKLCIWETRATWIYQCWLRSGLYESWCESELRNPRSALNRLGNQTAINMSRELGVTVDYEYPLADICE
jgi:hypothetical protein